MEYKKQLFLNLFIVFASVAFTFMVIEVAFRFKSYRDDIKVSRALQNISSADIRQDTTKNTPFGNIIRPSKNSRIIYEFVPNIFVKFKGQPVKINKHGFRGPAFDTSKNHKTLRIVGLGDSFMFGWGVKDDESYLNLLSNYLNQSLTNFKWEIINTAVPGYNTVMEVETLKEKGLWYSPDIVIINYLPNDLSLPNFIRQAENYFSIRRSFFVEFVSSRLKGYAKQTEHGLVPAPRRPSRPVFFEDDPRQVPKQYKDTVGIEAYGRAMSELKSLSIEHDFRVLVFCHNEFPGPIKQILNNLDFPLVEAKDAIEEFMSNNGIKKYLGSPLSVSDKDPHPSALAHKILAGVLNNYLQNSEVLDEIFERR